jgi:hypothetical protein
MKLSIKSLIKGYNDKDQQGFRKTENCVSADQRCNSFDLTRSMHKITWRVNMSRNGIIIALACLTFLAGVGAAVELFGGNTVQYAYGNGASQGGAYATSSPTSLDLGVKALAWATDGATGNGSAAFTGTGRVTQFTNITNPSDPRGFNQTVYYTGRVQAKVDKTSTQGTASAFAQVDASTTVSKTAGQNDAKVSGNAYIWTTIGDQNGNFNGAGTAVADATGSAGYSAQYINKSDKNVRTTDVKTEGSVAGETYLTAMNQKFTGANSNTFGDKYIDTNSWANENQGSYSESKIYSQLGVTNGATKTKSTISGFANATDAHSYAWDTNRTNIVPDQTNYNVYTKATGNLSEGAKAYENGDVVNTLAYLTSIANHRYNAADPLAFKVSSEMYTRVAAIRAIDNNTYRVEGTEFIDNGVSDSIAQGKLGTKAVNAESNIKTLTGGDDVGAGIFLSNKTSNLGFNSTAHYSQNAYWDNANKRFGLLTYYKMDNYGLNYTANTYDTGAIGVRMNILRTGKNLNANYGTTNSYTDIPTQKNWNWYGATIGSLNQGETISARSFAPSGQDTVNSQTYTMRHYTRELDTSNPQ